MQSIQKINITIRRADWWFWERKISLILNPDCSPEGDRTEFLEQILKEIESEKDKSHSWREGMNSNDEPVWQSGK